jgi:hypothetical protein
MPYTISCSIIFLANIMKPHKSILVLLEIVNMKELQHGCYRWDSTARGTWAPCGFLTSLRPSVKSHRISMGASETESDLRLFGLLHRADKGNKLKRKVHNLTSRDSVISQEAEIFNIVFFL